MSIGLVLFLALMLIPIVWGIVAYNRLVALRGQVGNAFAQIDVQLKRRFDLIPSLVDVAKKYMAHERSTLEAVMVTRNQAYHAARAASSDPGEIGVMEALSGANQQLADALSRLMVVVEDYPDLKADQTLLQLSEELSSTENKVAFARQAFNDAVTGFNVGIEQFPNSVIARLFQFRAARLLEATASAKEREPIKVEL